MQTFYQFLTENFELDDNLFHKLRLVSRYNRPAAVPHLDKLTPHIDSMSNTDKEDLAIFRHKPHLDKLINDKNEYVRGMVARHGDHTHHEKLLDDPSEIVREEIAMATSKKEHLHHMLKSPKCYPGLAKFIQGRLDNFHP